MHVLLYQTHIHALELKLGKGRQASTAVLYCACRSITGYMQGIQLKLGNGRQSATPVLQAVRC